MSIFNCTNVKVDTKENVMLMFSQQTHTLVQTEMLAPRGECLWWHIHEAYIIAHIQYAI